MVLVTLPEVFILYIYNELPSFESASWLRNGMGEGVCLGKEKRMRTYTRLDGMGRSLVFFFTYTQVSSRLEEMRSEEGKKKRIKSRCKINLPLE